MNKVVIYSTPTCPYCQTLKQYLAERKISFEDIDVANPANANRFTELMDKFAKQGMGEPTSVPIIEIGDVIMVGFNKDKINELLNIKE